MTSAVMAAIAVWLGAGAASGPTAAQTGPTILVAQSGALGAILTGGNGMTLYIFDGDNPNASNCDAGCVEAWPALVLAAGDPVAPPGLAGVLTTFTRGDGRRQVAYEGRPLYFFTGDIQVGDTLGDGVGGLWHVGRPASAAVPAGTSSPPATQPMLMPAPMPPVREPYEPGGMY